MQTTGTVVLSKRMTAVANMVSPGSITADIGCDHGFVSIYLIEQHVCSKVIAMDINDGPLKRAKEHIAQRNLSKYIEIRQSDGAKALNYCEDAEKHLEVDSMIAAGIGGRLMIKIMEDSMEKILSMKEIILQPQSEIAKVRHFLIKHGFSIVNEDMVFDEGKYYQIIKAIPYTKEKRALTLYEEWYGPILIKEKNPALCQYLLSEKEKYEGILSHIEKNKDSVTERLQLITTTLGFIL